MTISCVYHLAKNNTFTTYKVDIGNWIFSQIEKASHPIHHLLPSVIEEYVSGTLNRLKLGYLHEFRMKKFTETNIRQLFSNIKTDSMAPKVLVLYYLLYYRKQFIDIKTQEASKNMRNSVSNLETVDQILNDLEYSEDLMDSLPIQRILAHLHKFPEYYENIYPPLLSLIVTQFPRYFLSENLLVQEELQS